MSERSFLMMAGGTGGHIFPAMAVAKRLQALGHEVHWLGTETTEAGDQSMEARLVPEEAIPFHAVNIKGFRGKHLLRKWGVPFALLRAVWQAMGIIRRHRIHVVVGFGGYVSAPGGIAARLLNKKLVIHEQNSVAGSANRLLRRWADKTLEAFPDSLYRATWVGNPLRASVERLYGKRSSTRGQPKRLLVMGGSLGAEAINRLMPDALQGVDASLRPQVWHQTGRGKAATVVAAYQRLGIVARVDEFIVDVEEAYQWADVMIGRAGALTVSEVAVVGLPAIFIPYPHAIDNHQLINAQWLANQRAARVIEQQQLTADSLSQALSQLLGSDEVLNAMSAQLQTLAMPAATRQVVSACESLCMNEGQDAA